uniref:Uncharacterized protein n=1 Tax=Rhizophora mucronata TaxID=61149 RepID=A0A2P2NCY0_RHIMU
MRKATTKCATQDRKGKPIQKECTNMVSLH